MTFKWDGGRLHANIRALAPRMYANIAATVDFHADKGTFDLKTNAPWTDRTGAARGGLHTNTEHRPDRHTITFAHAVDYGIWLEIKNSGKYEVIVPTMVDTGKALMRDLEHVLGRSVT